MPLLCLQQIQLSSQMVYHRLHLEKCELSEPLNGRPVVPSEQLNGRPVVRINNDGVLPNFLQSNCLKNAVPSNSRLKIFSGTVNPTFSQAGRSDWDDCRWEWEDTPVGLVTLAASGVINLRHTHFSGVASSWDGVALSLVPIRASGYSVRSLNSRFGGRSQLLHFPFSVEKSQQNEDEEANSFRDGI